MTDTEVVPRKPDRPPAGKPPLVDAATADELLATARVEGVELLGPDGLLSQVISPDARLAPAAARLARPHPR